MAHVRMAQRARSRLLGAIVIAALASSAVAGCGGTARSTSSARTLLEQTFSGPHRVTSGNLSMNLTVDRTGAKGGTGPIFLSFGGPFQSLGTGKLPKSDFNLTISSSGRSRALAILSTGTAGYVTFQGTSYQLPQATFQRLESSFAGLAGSLSDGSRPGTLSRLGIHPVNWLVNPSVVGTENIGGAMTTHIRASVNVGALFADLSTLLSRASSLTPGAAAQLPSSISPKTRQRIASEVQSPTFDVWTGQRDSTIRKLAIGLTLPVSGQLRAELGGPNSARIGLTLQYADLNRPQTINAPNAVKPISEFATQLQGLLSSVQSGLRGR